MSLSIKLKEGVKSSLLFMFATMEFRKHSLAIEKSFLKLSVQEGVFDDFITVNALIEFEEKINILIMKLQSQIMVG
jgi:hypothetical protein